MSAGCPSKLGDEMIHPNFGIQSQQHEVYTSPAPLLIPPCTIEVVCKLIFIFISSPKIVQPLHQHQPPPSHTSLFLVRETAQNGGLSFYTSQNLY